MKGKNDKKKQFEELKYVNGAKHASCGIGFGPTVSCKYVYLITITKSIAQR